MKLPDNFPGRGRMLVQAFGLALLSACLGEFTAPQLASITVTVIPALGVGETAQASATLKDVNRLASGSARWKPVNAITAAATNTAAAPSKSERTSR